MFNYYERSYLEKGKRRDVNDLATTRGSVFPLTDSKQMNILVWHTAIARLKAPTPALLLHNHSLEFWIHSLWSKRVEDSALNERIGHTRVSAWLWLLKQTIGLI